MAIQMRRGEYLKFNPQQLLPGEWAIVLSGDVNDPGLEGKGVYVCFSAGDVRRMMTREELAGAIVDANPEAVDRLTEGVQELEAAIELAEQARVEAEDARAEAEDARVEAEDARAEAEMAREAAETLRQSTFETNEAAREASQDANDLAQAKNNSDQAQNNAAAAGITYEVLQEGQYALNAEGTHNVPTISGQVGKIYYTPKVDQSEENNLYEQWGWVNASWELMGEDAHISPVTTNDIDQIVSDQQVVADRYLNATGLTYLWAKLKAWAQGAFAALSHTHQASDISGITASRALVSDDEGHPSASPVTSTELGYLSGVESGVQGQIDSIRNSVSHRLLTDDESHGIWLDVCGKIGVIRIDTRRSIQAGVFDYIAALPDGILPLSSAADGEIGEYGVAASGSGGIVRVYIRGDDGRIGFFSTTAVSGITGSVPVILM